MSATRLRDLEKPNKYKDFLRAVARLQIRHPFFTLGLLFAITVALLGGVAQVQTVASLEKMMPSDVEEIKAFNTLRDQHLGQDLLAVIVEANPDSTLSETPSMVDYDHYRYVKSLKELIASEDAVISTYAFTDVVDSVAVQQGVSVDESTYNWLLASSQVQSGLSSFVAADRSNTIILIGTDVSANDARMNLLATRLAEDVVSAGTPAGSRTRITGTPVIQQKLGEVIEHDRALTEKLSAVFVFIVVAVIFGSIVAAFVPMASIVLSIIWLYGAMGYLHLPISTLAGGVAAMVIGIGVDFSIHLRNKFEYERKNGETLEYAIEETMANTGYVLTIVTAVTAIAFLTFLLGRMPEMGRFGLLMALGVTLAFVLSVIGLPALFVVEEKILYAIKARARFGIEHELELSNASPQGKDVERALKSNFENKHGRGKR